MKRGPGSRRERLARRLPRTLMEFPFEIVVGAYGLLAALAIGLGHAVPVSLDALLPRFVVYLWAAMLGLGGATVFVGLKRASAFVVAMGLRLVAGALFIFVLGAMLFAYSPALIPSALLIVLIAVLAGFRSFYLRTNALLLARHAAAREE